MSHDTPYQARIEAETGALYDELWNRFNEDDFTFALRESEQYFKLEPTWVQGKRCLDVGCGVGFFVRRLFEAGAQEVYAIDIGKRNRENTLRWNAAYKDRLQVLDMSALTLSFPDGFFDFTHSNGVLHHTPDPFKGFEELVRVCAPGGRVVVGLYGRGGIFPGSISILRKLVRYLPFSFVSRLISWIFPKPYDQYLVLDFLFVPIVNRYTEPEVRAWFEKKGLITIQRHALHSRYQQGGWLSRLLHGAGYITMSGQKPIKV